LSLRVRAVTNSLLVGLQIPPIHLFYIPLLPVRYVSPPYQSQHNPSIMNSHQPEASTSTQMPVTKHYCSLVIDPGLPREQYLKLIEAEGVVHSLVQRLLEKHGGDKHVRLFQEVAKQQQLIA